MTSVQAHPAVEPGSEDRWFVRAPEAVWRTIPGFAVVVLPYMDQDVVILSGTGLALWEELAEPCRLAEVAARFACHYGVPPSTVAESLGFVLDELRRHGAVLEAEG